MAGKGQACVSKHATRVHELEGAVGVHARRGVRLVIQRIGEGQRDVGGAVIAMIAGVGRARHDAAPYLSYRVLTDARGWSR